MFIINAPAFFTFIWKFCKGLVNKNTAEKIQIFSKPAQWKPALLELIDEDQLPEIFGGTCKCKHGCLWNDPGPWNPEGLLYDKFSKLPEARKVREEARPQQNLILNLDTDVVDSSAGFCDIRSTDLFVIHDIY